MLGEESDTADTNPREDGDDDLDAGKPSSDGVLAPGTSEGGAAERAKCSGAAGVVGQPEIVVEAVGPEQ